MVSQQELDIPASSGIVVEHDLSVIPKWRFPRPLRRFEGHCLSHKTVALRPG